MHTAIHHRQVADVAIDMLLLLLFVHLTCPITNATLSVTPAHIHAMGMRYHGRRVSVSMDVHVSVRRRRREREARRQEGAVI